MLAVSGVPPKLILHRTLNLFDSGAVNSRETFEVSLKAGNSLKEMKSKFKALETLPCPGFCAPYEE